jgi:hypothetical protein
VVGDVRLTRSGLDLSSAASKAELDHSIAATAREVRRPDG